MSDMTTAARRTRESQKPGQVKVKVELHPVFGKRRAFVDPPQISIGSESTKVPSVQWENSTGDKASLWFPNGGEVFDERPEDFLNPIDIPQGGLELKVKEIPEDGHYHYHVYCKAVKDCAHGHSEPRIDVP